MPHYRLRVVEVIFYASTLRAYGIKALMGIHRTLGVHLQAPRFLPDTRRHGKHISQHMAHAMCEVTHAHVYTAALSGRVPCCFFTPVGSKTYLQLCILLSNCPWDAGDRADQ